MAISLSPVGAHIGRSTGRFTPQGQTASGEEWQYKVSTLRVYIGRSTGISSSSQEWQFHFSNVAAHIGRSTGRFNPPRTDI